MNHGPVSQNQPTKNSSRKYSRSRRYMVPSWAITASNPSNETAGSTLIREAVIGLGSRTVRRPLGA
ncbi:hypothetical protein PGTUg99_016970 [Puccinia graminis f. sp. tritici]|uniref:Uncharacterized protein n=1 Tax=Puccinia graminis f. sp. tritici TaxID=56615 RepID=A0A5B0RD83_PUCGR|nr:hypothetical protein PGTUg99_016970 [Puccinia graminis f. sp. tritici]